MSRKILAIDDHPDTVRLIEMTLRRHGYEIIGAFSGQEGIRLAIAEQPDLILLDMMMPGMDGLTVCRTIRSHPTLKNTPIIVFSAKAQVSEKRESFEAGADDYLTKPTRPAELVERVNALVGRSERAVEDGEEAAQTDGERPSGKSRLITVLGSRGGAGTTTVAINLAAAIADGGSKSTLVDLDIRQGHIALYLGFDEPPDLVEWLNLPPSKLEEMLPYYLAARDSDLNFLLSCRRWDPQECALSASDVEALIKVLRITERSIIVDIAQQMNDAMLPLLQQSDSIIICLRPERPAIVSTKELVHYLQELSGRPGAGPSRTIHSLMLDFSRGNNLPRTSVEKYLGFRLIDVIGLDDRQITRAVNRNQPLIHLEDAGNVTRQFKRLAEQLVAAQA